MQIQDQLSLYLEKGITERVAELWNLKILENEGNPFCILVPEEYPIFLKKGRNWEIIRDHYGICVPLRDKESGP